MMRPALRSLLWYACLLAALAVGLRFRDSLWGGYVLAVAAGALAAPFAVRIKRWRDARRPPPVDVRVLLEAEGKLASQAFRATRAFFVDEYEDLGIHYYIALEDGRVLHLCGQYLYDYEPYEEDEAGDLGQEGPWRRRFPCTEFTILRHRDKGYVVDIVCAGRPLEPEVRARALTRREWMAAPPDGAIIADRSFDALKAERLAPAVA